MAGVLNTDEVKTDLISEKTAGSGVTIDGVLIKDGTVTTTAPQIASVDPAITALGSDDTDGYLLTKKINVITGGAGDTGVELMTAVPGLEVVVVNLTASDKKIYAGASDGIDDKTTTTGFIILHPEQVVRLYCYTAALWQSDIESAAFYQSLVTDTIDEFTDAAGVTVDGALVKDGSFIGKSATATATADGLDTGLLTGADQFVAVTSANADHIIALPITTSVPVGTKIRGFVGANGCKIRGNATETLTINGATSTNADREVTLDANTFFEATLVAALTWVITAVTGTTIEAPFPDSIA